MDSEKKLFCPVIGKEIDVIVINGRTEIDCDHNFATKCEKLGQKHLVGLESDCVLVRQSTDNGLSGLTPGIFFRSD